MIRPGINTETLESSSTTSPPTDVARGFMVGITESGPDTPVASNEIKNMDEYATVYAPSGETYLPGQIMFRSVNEFFRQGGGSLIVGRVTGPASKAATADITDAASAVVWSANAKGAGEWGNDRQVRIDTPTENPDIEANNYRIVVLRKSDGFVLESSSDLSSTEAAIVWSLQESQQIRIAPGVSILLPKNQTVDLTTGTNDITNVTNTEWQRGFDSLSTNLGVGVLMAPGQTTDQIHIMAAKHADTHDRTFFGDQPDTPTEATLIAASKAVVDDSGKRSRYSGLFWPWLVVPGNASGAVWKVPPSPAVAGLFARNMAAGMSANEPAAGDNGILRNVLMFTQTPTDVMRQNLNNNGTNCIIDKYGTPKVYGWRTTADPIKDKRWRALSNTILHRQIIALCNEQAERFIFRQIDGNNRLFGQVQSAIIGHVMMPMYEQGALSGGVPSEAYKVDVGPDVNTPETIEDGQINVVVTVRIAPFGEVVTIYIVKYLVTEEIPA